GDRPVGRLEPEDAAESAGDAARARAVRALMQRAEAGGRGGAGARAGAARRHRRVPWIARAAGERAVAEPLPAELRRRRLAEHDAAGLLETPYERRGGVRATGARNRRTGQRAGPPPCSGRT